MGASKFHLFTAEQKFEARVHQALAHPARISIIKYLQSKNYGSIEDWADATGLAPSTISQHVQTLLSAGLLQETLVRGHRKYAIRSEGWQQSRRLICEFFSYCPEASYSVLTKRQP